MATRADIIRVAKGEVGYSRWADELNGTKYGRWYARAVGNDMFAASGVPLLRHVRLLGPLHRRHRMALRLRPRARGRSS